jgi:hypothetical protein
MIRKLDDKFPGFQHRVKVHFRSIALTSTPFDRLLPARRSPMANMVSRSKWRMGSRLRFRKRIKRCSTRSTRNATG